MSPETSDQIRKFLNLAKAGDFQAFAKALTKIERAGIGSLKLPELLQPQESAFRVGITGPPGAGKSTLIGKLIGELRSLGLKVGILAVDPSSPFTNGAILGDRIRYSDHFSDPGVFIRSLGSRGSLGGLSASAYLMLRAYDFVGFDIVLIETVGVGQTELEIMHVADFVSVVLVPESGDAIQAMKAGLLEIADQFIVNKSDRPGAESLVRELEATAHMGLSATDTADDVISVFQTVATEGRGLPELAEIYKKMSQQKTALKNRFSPQRLQWEGQALLRSELEYQIVERTQSIQTPAELLTVLNAPR